MMQPLQVVLNRLEGVNPSGKGYTARCPAHDDTTPSLSIREGDDGRVLIKCHAGCRVEDVVSRIDLTMSDLFSASHQPIPRTPRKNSITVEDLAADKHLPVEFLKSIGLENHPDGVLIPYNQVNGKPASRHRLRTDLIAKEGSLWTFGKGKPVPYGSDRLNAARELGFVVFVEGESDAWTLWHHEYPALGIPGATMTGFLQGVHVRGLKRIYIFSESDSAGKQFVNKIGLRLAKIGWKGQAFVVTLTDVKDPNALHQLDPDNFRSTFQAAMDSAEEMAPVDIQRSDSATTLSARLSLSGFSSDVDLERKLREVGESLVGADPLRRQVARESVIKELRDSGIQSPAKLVDAAFAIAMTKRGSDDNMSLVDPEPCEDAVDGGAVLDELRLILRRYVVLPRYADVAVALWIVFSYCLDACFIAPILAIGSPVMRCGKTTLLTIVLHLVPRALSASNITPAAVFRTIDRHQPTLLMDEADTYVSKNDDLRGILNSGHTRATAHVVRLVGDNHEPKHFSTWCARAIALIGRLPSTLEDRSILISMRRRMPGEKVEKLRLDRISSETEVLQSKLARWSQDHLDALRQIDPEIPADLDDRAQDNWRILLSIADLVGGEWPELARQAAISLSVGRNEDEQSYKTLALTDLRDLFLSRRTDRLTSADVVKALLELEDRPWQESNRGRALSPNQFAKLLRYFEIRPKTIRVGSSTAKGYRMEDCKDAFSRYLPIQPSHRNNVDIPSLSDEIEPSQSDPCDGCGNEEKDENGGIVTGVTVRQPSKEEQEGQFQKNEDHPASERERFDL